MKKYLEELKTLNLPIGMFAVFGSAPLGIRGLREVRDLDIIVKKDLWNELSKKHIVIDKNGACIELGNIEIWEKWDPWFDDVDKLIDDAEIIGEFPFVKLKYVLRWKQAMNREKDQEDIKLIEEYLAKE